MSRGPILAILLALSTMPINPAGAKLLCVENTDLTDLRAAFAEGKVTATALTEAYLARIAAYDVGGPQLNSVREINPDALAIAERDFAFGAA